MEPSLKTNIAHVTFDMRIGGTERVITTLVNHMDTAKFNVSIICLESVLGPFGRELKDAGYSVVTLGRRPGFDLWLAYRIHQYIKANHLHILHCHQYTPFVYGVLGSLCTRCRVIFTEHGRMFPDARKPKRLAANPLLCRLANNITAISNATKDALIQYENIDARRIEVIYNGIASFPAPSSSDIERLKREFKIEPNDFIIGNVARIDTNKNQQLMLEAMSRITRSNTRVKLIIVGDGPQRRDLERMVIRLNIQSSVHFAGYRTDAQLFYPLFDLFLLTSRTEGTAMTLLEAMAAGIPCIVSDVGGNPEIVLDGQNGYVIPDNDVLALVKKIGILFREPERRKEMGKNGRQRFMHFFSANRMAQAYTTIYTKLHGLNALTGTGTG
jgi:glycosyltransferase involved in cell wall biosynthesis